MPTDDVRELTRIQLLGHEGREPDEGKREDEGERKRKIIKEKNSDEANNAW